MKTLSDKIVKTRKPHICFACGRKFPAGTKMTRQVNDYDGIQSVYSCLTCQELMDNYSEYFYDYVEYMYLEGCVRECYECQDITPEQLLEKLQNNA